METVMEAKSNLLIPPIGSDFFSRAADTMLHDDSWSSSVGKCNRLYGTDVAKTIADNIPALLRSPGFRWAHTALGLSDKEDSFGYL